MLITTILIKINLKKRFDKIEQKPFKKINQISLSKYDVYSIRYIIHFVYLWRIFKLTAWIHKQWSYLPKLIVEPCKPEIYILL